MMTNCNFKCELTKYYTLYAAEHLFADLDDTQQTVVVSGGLEQTVLSIGQNVVGFVDELSSNQEEADSRMVLHASYAVKMGATNATSFSPDTDVIVLLLHHFDSLGLEQVFFNTGRNCLHTDQSRNIPVHTIADKIIR